MGNSLGGKKSAKIMKINGETIKQKVPVLAGEVLNRYPRHVLIESETFKHFGIRAQPLDPMQELKPRRLYFLLDLPISQQERGPRRVRSGIHMTAKDRLESLMLARRSVSDLTHSIAKSPASIPHEDSSERDGLRMKVRLPKAAVEKLMVESKNEAEAAAKILDLCVRSHADGAPNEVPADRGSVKGGAKTRERRVGFKTPSEAEIQLVTHY